MKKPAAAKRKTQSSQEIDDLFVELKKEYLATFQEKQELIKIAWAEHDRDKLENEFHKMKGTGRTYGLPEISVLGGMMELLCKENHPKLGLCVFMTLEILPKIVDHHNHIQEYKISDDFFYKRIKELYCELTPIAS